MGLGLAYRSTSRYRSTNPGALEVGITLTLTLTLIPIVTPNQEYVRRELAKLSSVQEEQQEQMATKADAASTLQALSLIHI